MTRTRIDRSVATSTSEWTPSATHSLALVATGIGLALTLMVGVVHATEPGTDRLWYRQPAQVWTEALPVGNGRLGAMVHGAPGEEHLQLNEETLWSGGPNDYAHPGAAEVLPELRRLLWEGKQKEAEALAMERFMSVPLRQLMYQPLGDVRIELPGHEAASDYTRDLNLHNAIASVSYRVGEVAYVRETFSSAPDHVIVEHIHGDRPGAVSGTIRIGTVHPNFVVRMIGTELHLSGRVGGDGLTFAARLKVLAEGGKTRIVGDGIEVSGADAVTVLITAASAYQRFDDIDGAPELKCAETLAAAAAKSYAALRADHVADYASFYNRVRLDLGTTPIAAEPTDVRLEVTEKSGDPALATLLFNYGRYLLISSSRPGTHAANLQGIWNDLTTPPWGSKYTTNINLEMNYWPAEVANLSEMAEPLFDLIDDVTISGAKTAQVHYNAPGWVLHHNTDGWRGTAPINNANHGIWPTGGAWLCWHLWEHWRFTGDRTFLAERAYPVMRGAAEFFVATLVEDPNTGRLISGPSNSPEHGGLVMGPTMDHQLIRALFGFTAEAAAELGIDADFAAQLTTMAARIAPNQIGQHGQLQEWLEDKDDPENNHRHVSHLWGVFPGEDITWQQPDLMRAARQSLEYRGDGGTGWSLGWKISLWARFLDGDHARKILLNQLNVVHDDPVTRKSKGGGGVYPNLFDAHPPFQIDGNFAATAGICEMLVQSHTDEIVLLPALPLAWGTGSVSGLRARGGFEIDLAWQDGALTSVTVRSLLGKTTKLRSGNLTTDITLAAGESRTFNHLLN